MDGKGVPKILLYYVFRFSHGMMGGNMKENIRMIRNMDMESLNGLMEE